MVVAIFPETAALMPVIDGLKAIGADLEKLRVLTIEEVPTELASAGPQFVWLGDVERATIPGGLGSDGTGVPGLSTGGSSPTEVHGDELLEGLSEMGIPDGRSDDYAQAVEAGSTIVGYPSFSDSAALRQLFSSNGATSVEEL
jgi:hypothetical protein